MVEIKAWKPVRSEDVVNYSITANMLNVGRKAEVLHKFSAWASGIIKDKINESFKLSFCGTN